MGLVKECLFGEFYSSYPRKEAKKDAFKAWLKLTKEQQAIAVSAIETHVARWNVLETQKEFIPLPASWLRGWRFDDEIEMPKPKILVQSWLTSDATVLAKGRELGNLPRPGEDMHQYKGRLIDSINKSKIHLVAK